MSASILIIDDSKFQVKQHKIFFEEVLELDVVALGFNGQEAVSLYKKHLPDFICLDITMPKQNGEEAIKKILHFDPNAKIIVISAIQGDRVMEIMEHGVKLFYRKPLKMTDPSFIQQIQLDIQKLKSSSWLKNLRIHS